MPSRGIVRRLRSVMIQLIVTVLLGALVAAFAPAVGAETGDGRDGALAAAMPASGLGLAPPIEGTRGTSSGGVVPLQAPVFGETSGVMIGTVRVSVILMESDGTTDTQTENWAAAERTNVQNEIQAGLDWWDGRALARGIPLTFTVDWTNLNAPIATGLEPINRCGPCGTGEAMWITHAMNALGYTAFGSYFTNVRDYNNDLRTSAGADWAFTIFIIDSSNDANNRFTDNFFAYAYFGGPFLVMTYGNNGWGIGAMDQVGAHEMGHVFYAQDEYAASGCTIAQRSGYYNTANANCQNGGTGTANIMIANTLTGASPLVETREMIGWRDSDGDGIQDVVDTIPDTTLNAHVPDPTADTTPMYTGSAADVPMTNNNPNGPGTDFTINTIANVQYRVDAGAWIGASATDGAFDFDVETLQFTTAPLSSGTHTICARATNSVGNVETVFPCDTLTIDLPPTANAGPDQSVGEGATVTFNGGGSSDDFGITAYEWDFDVSVGVTFSPPDATGVGPTDRYGDNGVYTVTLRVTDTLGRTDTDTLQVTVNNVAPTVNAGAAQTVNEGATVSVSASFSDPGWLDTHTSTINWGEGTIQPGALTEENVKPDATGTVTGSHTYGDNGAFIVTVSVTDDDGATGTGSLTVTVNNLAPVVDALSAVTINEGQSVTFTGHTTDAGSDDLTSSWVWGSRSACGKSTTYLNSPPNPDPLPSPSVNPRDITETASCMYGDNGVFAVTLTVTDDDGGTTTVSTTVTVLNVAPSVSSLVAVTMNEGQVATFTGQATDPGSDDLTFTWTWTQRTPCDTTTTYLNDAVVGPDPLPSPTVNPRNVAESRSCTYGDNGVFTVSLTVTDDDGGSTTVAATLTVLNVMPTVGALAGVTINEGGTVAFTGTATDPGSDDLTFAWSWGARAPCDTTAIYLNDATVGPDPLPSPTVNPRAVSEGRSCPYGDNGVFAVTLTVTDDDGGTTTVSTTVTVLNVAPAVTAGPRAYVVVDVTLRVAGEKWHDVNLTLLSGGSPTRSAIVVRTPGSPDVQAATLAGERIYLVGPTTGAVVRYTPMNDPVNGEVWGGTPVWVILTLENGQEVWIEHTFNVRHPGTWVWTIPDLLAYVPLVNLPIHFEATSTDPGSDDLTFAWAWGDPTPATSTIYYNDGVAPDPFPSPDVNPIAVTDHVTHAFSASGTYTVTLTVTDDDGGSVAVTMSVAI